jgi:hypothetical protein
VKTQAVEDRLGSVAADAVRQVQQTYTDNVRTKDGTLTLADQQMAMAKALSVVKSNLGAEGVAAIKSVLKPDDVEQRIVSAIESAHHEIKADAAAARQPDAVAVATANAPVAEPAPSAVGGPQAIQLAVVRPSDPSA